jgi:hypothetical protein
MRKVVRLTESDLVRIVKRVINEELETSNPKMKKYKIGDILYSQTFSPGKALKFKITKISNDGYDLYIDGIITGLKGDFEPESGYFRSAKVGDPIWVTVSVNEPKEYYRMTLPKTGGEMEYTGGERFSKQFTKN